MTTPCDTPHHHCQELVDCSFTKVIACRVGASFAQSAKTGHLSCAKRRRPPCDGAAADGHIEEFLRGEVRLREFTLKELKKATYGFCWRIGLGGFGEIHRGTLSDGTSVAIKIKRPQIHPWDSKMEQFQAELKVGGAIANGSHPNLVPVIGYHYSCSKKRETATMIVYSFIANGDLGRYIGDHALTRILLDWPTRKRIALGVARGISSLHRLGIVHRDIKPSNVMLDENFDAHVGDFGLAKFTGLPRNSYDVAGLHGDVDSNHYDVSGVVGTTGYISPELLLHGRCSRKSDVYAFGVTLIQIVTGKERINQLEGGMHFSVVLHRAEQLFKNEEDLTGHMHPSMLGMYDESEAIELIQLGLICGQHDPERRPLMPEVIAIMEGSSTALKHRWDNYDYTKSDRQLSDDPSETDSENSIPWTIFTNVRARGSGSVDDEMEVRSAIETNENQLQQADDFSSSKEHRAGLTGFANAKSLENDALAEIVQVDPNEVGNSKQLSSQANRHEGQSNEVATKQRKVLDQMRAMELSHQVAMEEMYQKQTAIMHSMIKMQEQYIRNVNEMQSQIDQLNEVSQKL